MTPIFGSREPRANELTPWTVMQRRDSVVAGAVLAASVSTQSRLRRCRLRNDQLTPRRQICGGSRAILQTKGRCENRAGCATRGWAGVSAVPAPSRSRASARAVCWPTACRLTQAAVATVVRPACLAVDAHRHANDRSAWRSAPFLGEHQRRRLRGSLVLRTKGTSTRVGDRDAVAQPGDCITPRDARWR